MGEAIMASVGRSGVLPGIKWKLKTRIYTSNGQFTVPSNIRNNELKVMCYGGGGGALNSPTDGSTSGGGGGYMNLKVFNNINSLEIVNINIGKGYLGTGGSTMFGKYLSANGGQSGRKYDGTRNSLTPIGGNGGSGGGGGPSGSWSYDVGGGGNAESFGGGGSGGYAIKLYGNHTQLPTDRYEATDPYNVKPDSRQSNFTIAVAGSGGPWGGGGGGLIEFKEAWIGGGYRTYGLYTKKQGISNGNGGNGGIGNNGNSGNKINNTSLIIDNDLIKNLLNNPLGGNCVAYSGGGGGGYGGAGGMGGGINSKIYNQSSTYYTLYHIGGCGGGGGYGANGGNGYCYNAQWASEYFWQSPCGGGGGGGGGFGGKGADGNWTCGGGGGGYGPSNYGAGGGGSAINGAYGKDGICIIQYYEMVVE